MDYDFMKMKSWLLTIAGSIWSFMSEPGLALVTLTMYDTAFIHTLIAVVRAFWHKQVNHVFTLHYSNLGYK